MTLTAALAQQLALARVMLADPPVAVLDEATAEAGGRGRAAGAAAAAVTADRTTLVIAHRLTQAATADRIVVMAPVASSKRARTRSWSAPAAGTPSCGAPGRHSIHGDGERT